MGVDTLAGQVRSGSLRPVAASAGWCRMATLCRPSSELPSSPSSPVPMITRRADRSARRRSPGQSWSASVAAATSPGSRRVRSVGSASATSAAAPRRATAPSRWATVVGASPAGHDVRTTAPGLRRLVLTRWWRPAGTAGSAAVISALNFSARSSRPAAAARCRRRCAARPRRADLAGRPRCARPAPRARRRE